ncbi:MAG TPA: hypothetical protein VFF27_17350 [Bacteroidia bacterium]|jgi:hypothetical protein|nr:hypothetical protein [Bacteroidia bacterium]
MKAATRISFIVLFQLFYGLGMAQCDVAKIVGINKSAIDPPYRYDGFSIKEIPFVTSTANSKEIHSEFIAFDKQTYKVVFCAAGFTEDVVITIYNKKKPSVKVAEQTINASNMRWVFEPLKPGIYDIVYKPAVSSMDAEHKGCIIMLIGFKK